MTTRNGKVRVDRRGRRRAQPVPSRPYRGTALLHAVLALIIVAVALLTGGELAQAFVVAGLYFFVATAYAWWRFRQRLQRAAREGEGAG